MTLQFSRVSDDGHEGTQENRVKGEKMGVIITVTSNENKVVNYSSDEKKLVNHL